eukprot:UN20154
MARRIIKKNITTRDSVIEMKEILATLQSAHEQIGEWDQENRIQIVIMKI